MNIATVEQKYILESIAVAVHDALEELGLDTTRANFEVRDLYMSDTMAAPIKNAAMLGLASYRRKLDLMGGIPKPASV